MFPSIQHACDDLVDVYICKFYLFCMVYLGLQFYAEPLFCHILPRWLLWMRMVTVQYPKCRKTSSAIIVMEHLGVDIT